MQLRWQIRRGAHFQRILISATARTLSLRRLRDSARGLSKEYPGRLRMQLARRPAGSRARAGGAAQFTISSARACSIPVFHVDIRLYAIGQTVQTYVGHEKVMEITTMWGSLRLAPIMYHLFRSYIQSRIVPSHGCYYFYLDYYDIFPIILLISSKYLLYCQHHLPSR